MSSQEARSPYPFRLFYFWVGEVLERGWQCNKELKPMSFDDLLTLPEDEDAVASYAAFKNNWEEAIRIFNELPEEKREGNIPGIFVAFIKSFPHGFIMGAIGRILADGCTFASPFILREFINWLGKYVYIPGTNSYEGFIWAIVLALLQLAMSFFNNMSYFYSAKTFAQMRSAIAVTVFEKSMTLPADHGLTGVASQLHTTDSSKFIELAFFFHQMWSSVLLIVGSLIALYFFIGYAGLIALGIIVVITPFQGGIMGAFAATRRAASQMGDRRMTAVNELVQGIRIVKFMGWEKAIMKRIQGVRSEEIGKFTTLHVLRSTMVIIMSFQAPLVSYIVFTFAYRYFDEEITATRVFPALAMLNILRLPLAFLPMSLSKFVDFRVSLDRITNFLLTPSRTTYVEFAKMEDGTAVKLENLSVEVVDSVSGSKSRILDDINLKIPKNKLTIITGPTGSGKSTLVQSIIGEMPVVAESSVVVDGTFAYVPQEPWIIHSTVRRNIVLVEEEDIDFDRYTTAVRSCQLMADLHQLKASDETMIGELGINISGGQKQRVALARSVYCKHDVVILDDPLSAVDSHVCTSIFDEAICGSLNGRTRVLVTHHIQFLPRADYIILMDEGKVRFAGTYNELERSDIDVTSLLKTDESTPEAEKTEKDVADLDLDDVDDAIATKEPISQVSYNDDGEIPKASADALMSIEQQEVGGISGSTFLWYVGLLGPMMITVTVLFYLLWRTITVAADLTLSWWTNATPIFGNTLTDDEYAKWYMIFTLSQLGGLIIRQIPYTLSVLRASRLAHHLMINRLIYAPTSFFDTNPTGRILSRFSKDIEMLDMVIPDTLNFVFNITAMLLGAVVIMCYSAPYLSILVVIMVAVYVFLFRYYVTTNRILKRMEATTRGPMTSALTETFRGLSTVRAYNSWPLFTNTHNGAINKSSSTFYSWRNAQRWVSVRTDAIAAIIILGCGMFAAGLIQSASTADRPDLLPIMSLAVTYSMSMAPTVGFLTITLADAESSFTSVDRCREYTTDIPQEKTVTYGNGPEEHPPLDPSWPSSGALELQNVCLRYAPDKPQVLKNISVSIKSGSRVGIVGRTGSGKSTLMLALFRMVEIDSGSISLDNRNIDSLTMEDLRSKLTIIPQDPTLFTGTVRSNLDPFDNSTDEEVWNVIRKVGLEDRILRDVGGLTGPVTERGVNFSVGERQLLCLGRAMLKDCKILLLDEATASVDFECDKKVQQTIKEEFKNCTVLTIAHRLTTIIESDAVMVLEGGELKEWATPVELLEDRNGAFHSMVARLGQQQFDMLLQMAKEEDAKKKKISSIVSMGTRKFFF